MAGSIKKIGLFVPAWWPCSFFENQQAVYSPEYELYNLYGVCTWLAHKEQFRQLLLFHSLNNVESQLENNSLKIKIQCAKFRSRTSTARAITSVSEEIGKHILKATNGIIPCFIYIQSRSDIAIFVAEWAKRNHIRIIFAEHILYIRHEINYISRRRENLFSAADQVFCVSNYLYRNLLTSGLKLNDVKVIGNLVSEYAIPTEWRSIKKNGRIIFVASHFHDKDIQTFIAVANRQDEYAMPIDVYGLSGVEHFNGKALHEHITSPFVSFKGKVPHNDLLERYAEYTLLLSTSVSETFGLSVAEAIAHGTPVVCTDSGGVRDFVNEKNGVLVGIKDIDGICAAIRHVATTVYDSEKLSKEILSRYGLRNYQINTKLYG